MQKTEINKLIKTLVTSPGYLGLSELAILKNFYTVYIECITVQIVSLYDKLTEFNKTGEYYTIQTKLDKIEWYINFQTRKLKDLFYTYIDNPSKLCNIEPNEHNKEFYEIYQILTNVNESSNIFNSIVNVSEEAAEIFTSISKDSKNNMKELLHEVNRLTDED